MDSRTAISVGEYRHVIGYGRNSINANRGWEDIKPHPYKMLINRKHHCPPPSKPPCKKPPKCIVDRDVNSICRLCVDVKCNGDHVSDALASELPDGIDRTQIGAQTYVTRMWNAYANQVLDEETAGESYTKSWAQLEGKYTADQQRVVGFHKGFEHDMYGHLTAAALSEYQKLVCGIVSKDIDTIIEVKGYNPSGASPAPSLTYAGVLDAMNGTVAGMNSTSVKMADSHQEFGDEKCAEIVEDYLRGLCLDIPFVDYPTAIADPDPLKPLGLAKSILETSEMREYFLQAPVPPNVAYSASTIFRGNNAGAQKGPLVSQLFYHNIPGGPSSIPGVPNWKRVQKYTSAKRLAQSTSAVSWGFTPGQSASLLNGLTTELYNGGGATVQTSAADARTAFHCDGRSLATYVLEEPRAQAAYDATLVLSSWGLQFNEGLGGPFNNNRDNNTNAHPASPQTIAAFLANNNNTLAFYWKYFTNRGTRVEAMGLYTHNALTGVGGLDYGFPDWYLGNAVGDSLKPLWDAVKQDNALIASKYSGALPPPAIYTINGGVKPSDTPSYTFHTQTRVGNPRHPSFPAGHSAAISGLFAAKFFYKVDVPLSSLAVFKLVSGGQGQPAIVPSVIADGADLDYSKLLAGERVVDMPYYLEANEDGSKLIVRKNGDNSWTVADEINKMASNIAHARDWLGMHIRSEDNASLHFAEEAVIRFCKDLISLWSQNELVNGNPVPPAVSYTKYNGETVIISPHTY